MSKLQCDACYELTEYASEFVNNGVTDRVAASLKNDTGFNPSLTALHKNCEDLNDANDCLVGHLADSIDAHEVCDWKQYMHKLVPNLYELLKAIIASMCGLWARFKVTEKKTNNLCDAVDSVFDIIKGNDPPKYKGEWLQSFLDKTVMHDNGGGVYQSSTNHPAIAAEVLSGSGCDASKKQGRWMPTVYNDVDAYPYSLYIELTQPIQPGEVLGIVPRSAVPKSVISEDRWKDICRNGSQWPWRLLNSDTIWYIRLRGYTVINGIEMNTSLRQYGEDNLAFIVDAMIGPSRQGNAIVLRSGSVRLYDV